MKKDSNKIMVHANSGRVISLYLNVSLACDYRIVADNTVFQNPDIELGLVPKGGGPYFLSKRLGLSKAYEILLSGEDVTAHEAFPETLKQILSSSKNRIEKKRVRNYVKYNLNKSGRESERKESLPACIT